MPATPEQASRDARVAAGFRAQAEIDMAYAEEHRLRSEVCALRSSLYRAWAARDTAMADATTAATFDERERAHRRQKKARLQADALAPRIAAGEAAYDTAHLKVTELLKQHKALIADMEAAMRETAEAMSEPETTTGEAP